MKRRSLLIVVLLVAGGTASAESGTTTRVSTTSEKGKTFSFRPWMSADGRFVAYDSDVGGVREVFVHDRATSVTERASVAGGGARADGDSSRPTISADGRHVAFWSKATNLVPGDTNRRADAFVHDRVTGTTVRVSVASDGTQGNGDSARAVISGDGRLVAYESTASNLVPGDAKRARRVFVRDLAASTTTQVGEGVRPSISDDGRWVAFNSDAALVPEDDNHSSDVYVRDLAAGTTARVSVASGGGQSKGGSYSPSISADGRLVAFWSSATNLVAGDTNGVDDIFVHDRATGSTTRVSVAGDGTQANRLSADADVSPDGRWVAFWSSATNLVAGDTNRRADVFLHDRASGATTRVSVASDGTQSDDHSYSPNVSAGGEVVAFDSLATNLVLGQPHPGSGVFTRTRSA
jgi:Tol biopolymer transport system component